MIIDIFFYVDMYLLIHYADLEDKIRVFSVLHKLHLFLVGWYEDEYLSLNYFIS